MYPISLKHIIYYIIHSTNPVHQCLFHTSTNTVPNKTSIPPPPSKRVLAQIFPPHLIQLFPIHFIYLPSARAPVATLRHHRLPHYRPRACLAPVLYSEPNRLVCPTVALDLIGITPARPLSKHHSRHIPMCNLLPPCPFSTRASCVQILPICLPVLYNLPSPSQPITAHTPPPFHLAASRPVRSLRKNTFLARPFYYFALRLRLKRAPWPASPCAHRSISQSAALPRIQNSTAKVNHLPVIQINN